MHHPARLPESVPRGARGTTHAAPATAAGPRRRAVRAAIASHASPAAHGTPPQKTKRSRSETGTIVSPSRRRSGRLLPRGGSRSGSDTAPPARATDPPDRRAGRCEREPSRRQLRQRNLGRVEDEQRRVGDDGHFATDHGGQKGQDRRGDGAAAIAVESEEAEGQGRYQARPLPILRRLQVTELALADRAGDQATD